VKASQTTIHIPVKFFPKTKSLGGSRSFGVVVLVMDSLDGSMAARPAPDSELYALAAAQTADARRAVDCLGVPRRHNWRSILVGTLDEATFCQRGVSVRESRESQRPSI
jgi:hypothetical protein